MDGEQAPGLWERPGRFMAAEAGYDAARWVLAGAPLELTVSYRAGTRWGPARIREASYALETYSPDLDRDLEEQAIHDAGDVALPLGNLGQSLARIEAALRRPLADGKALLVLGGEHLVTLAAVNAALDRYPDLVVVQLDAHTDLRDRYLGEPYSHATVMRRVLDLVGPGRLWQLGPRSGLREEFELARREGRFFRDVGEGAEALAAELAGPLRGVPVYLTVDIDVLDPAVAPGTGTPEPGGPDFATVQRAIYTLARAGARVVAADVVETAPPLDPSGRTEIVAAKLVREILLAFAPAAA
ncbi:agmatinase [Thermaerobacter marianensis DSM 12885]|uniref:Agmatinase n=1 Tax=Thermaerobacter marianensis (strain ATCC 700841 / DSM 12885 / JCM 10246 / 7p75a) TaxID=644966 RepID=E6SLH5_THEM7|nr:agmatinase [Thermaerobacter marianensis]ADU52417.1 agmatinase [Thermaerobacter marianensis DSM 12885]